MRMHDRLAKRDQLQGLDELLAGDVLTEEATGACQECWQECQSAVCEAVRMTALKLGFVATTLRTKSFVVGPHSLTAYEPNAGPCRGQIAFGFFVKRREYVHWPKGGFGQYRSQSVADESTWMSHDKGGYATHCRLLHKYNFHSVRLIS